MSLRARVTELEGRISTGAVHFRMPNGSFRRFSAARFGHAFADALRGRRTPDVEVILASTWDDAGAHITDVVRVMCAAREQAAHFAEERKRAEENWSQTIQ